MILTCAGKLTSLSMNKGTEKESDWDEKSNIHTVQWRTDGRTDGFTIASTALCIASYADSL